MKQLNEAFIVSGARTPIGDFGGSLSGVSALYLAQTVVEAALERAGVDKPQAEEIIMGNCIQRSDEPNIARCVAVDSGFPKETTGVTVQRQCSSGMQAAAMGYQELVLGDVDVVVAGGVESMSNAPYVLKDARWGQRLQHGQLTDYLWEMLTDPHYQILMGETAENLAEMYHISREEQDEVALRSHLNASSATEEGRFAEEIVPVKIPQKKGDPLVVDKDEHPRGDLTMEKLAALKPAFRKDGTVTAGNASGINDGASALLMMNEKKVKELGLSPMARIISYAFAGVEGHLMGYGPVPATRKALEKAGLALQDMELIELNEAFAAQYLACEKLLELDRDKVNVNGSGVGLGHPVGSTGNRIILSLLYEMKRRGLKRGLATLCVGGGMGMATVLERV